MNRHHLPSPHRKVTPETRALLVYGLVVALGTTAAVLILTGMPFTHVPVGI